MTEGIPLIKAKRAGLIDQVKPQVDELTAGGEYWPERLRQEVLRLAGELDD